MNAHGKPRSGAPVPAARKTSSVPRRRRIIVVDDHPMTRSGLVHLINRQRDLVVCGEAGNPAEALTAIEKEKPDLLITDVTMPGRGGLEFIKDVATALPQLPILVISMHDELLYAERAFRSGARGFVMKEAGAAVILTAIRRILAGQIYASERLSSKIFSRFSGEKRNPVSPVEILSDRELEIFHLIGQGKTTKQIAAELQIRPKTVDVHRSNLKQKLKVPDGTALLREAIHWVEAASSGPPGGMPGAPAV